MILSAFLLWLHFKLTLAQRRLFVHCVHIDLEKAAGVPEKYHKTEIYHHVKMQSIMKCKKYLNIKYIKYTDNINAKYNI